MTSKPLAVTSFEQINWSNWTPDQTATLMFVIKNGKILLIRKKRGLGAGKINGPGGRIDPGETAEQCAVRETQEELLITPRQVEFSGELYFQFADGFKLHGFVYRATDYEGTPTETDEALPVWTPIDKIPYGEMWADDRYWLPLLLKGHTFTGRFLFDGDTLLGYDLNCVPPTISA
jgi:8-oxo-dGTP diphosphatase